MGYEAGNLELSILGFSEKAVSSIDVTAKALRRLATSVDKINNTQFVFAGQKMEVLFTKIAKASNSINTANLENLAVVAKSLSSISKISALDKVDFEKVGKGFSTLSTAIQPFLDKVREAESSLNALYGILSKASGKKLQSIVSSKGGGFLGLAKRGVSLHLMRRMGRLMANIAQSGANYTETLNLWETSMGNNLNVATEFVNKMNEAYGISEKTLMNAQAIFKNMLGSLGQISDTMAYSLSEGITQMALDYASLYNVTFENAFTKFQAALAGQVRPIRSVSGYDITENTIFQLYQSLGGEKTMRQLSRTEKQLLSILAVFRQMDASGAVGDLEKTMGSFANQSRVWAESLNEVKTWLGVIITYTIQESGIMIKLNAMLITVARYLEAVARNIGAIQSFGGSDPFAGTEQSAENAIDAIDKLNGKLLDFDKFRSLSGGQENALGLDEKLLAALSGYGTILGNASLEARELSDQYLKSLGFTIDTNGELILTNEQLKSAKDKINGIISALAKFDGLGILQSLFPIASTFFTTLAQVAPAIVSISTAMTPIVVGLLNSVAEIVTLLDKTGQLEAVINTIIAYKIGMKIIGVGTNIAKLGEGIYKLTNTYLIPFLNTLKTANSNTLPLAKSNIDKIGLAFGAMGIVVLGLGINEFVSNFDNLSTKAKVWIPILASLAGVITAVAAGLTFMKGNWIGAIGLGATVAGIGLMVGTQLAIPNYEMGASDIDSGTVFRAGEFGKTEAVYTGSNGKTNVANIQQMKAAYSQSLNEWWAIAKNDIPAFQGVSDSGLYTIVNGEAKKRGKTFAKV